MCFSTASPMATSVPLRPQDRNRLMPLFVTGGWAVMFASDVSFLVL